MLVYIKLSKCHCYLIIIPDHINGAHQKNYTVYTDPAFKPFIAFYHYDGFKVSWIQ